MSNRRMPRRLGLGLVLLGCALPILQGCTYLKYRAEDAADMMDLGVTWTQKPTFSLYACLMGLSSMGAGCVDGKFAGIGGGQVGVQRYVNKNMGLLIWTYEEIAFGDFDLSKPETLTRWHAGPIGWVKYFPRRPSYAPS